MQFNAENEFLITDPMRYKVLYGGRGGGKSRDMSGALTVLGTQKPCRIVCCRDTDKSIIESVHQLFEGHITRHSQLKSWYDIKQKKITGKNGTEIMFAGLRNPESLKSFEGADYIWIEEAVTVSKHAWNVLTPTIRKENSEIWISFNPDLETDETYKRFVLNPPQKSIVKKINYTDNPFCTQVMIDEANACLANDEDEYNHIYLGFCKQALEGAIFAKEIRNATTDGRITRVPVLPNVEVHTFWDLGYADFTSVWFVQYVGMETRIVDFYQNQFENLSHYFKMLKEKDYYYGFDYLPHDSDHATLSNNGNSIRSQFKQAGRKVKLIPIDTIANGIQAVRQLFPSCVFDEERCADGLNALRRYCYGFNQNSGQYSKDPRHDENSHAADAFRYVASAHKADRSIIKKPRQQFADSDYNMLD